MTPTLHIFTTGGSIDKTYLTQVSDFVVGPPQIADILRDANIAIEYALHELMRKDSLQLTDADRAHIVDWVRASPHAHILITHGTDTMPATGQALMAANLRDKTIVLTGAMRPAAFRDSDAPFNIGCAVMAAQTLPPGVYIAMHGLIFDPARVRKNTSLDRFEAI